MKVAIDARMIHHTGIGTYIRGLLTALAEREVKWQFVLHGHKNSLAKFLEQKNKSFVNWQFLSFTSKIYSIQEQLLYISKLRSCDLWHAPHYNAPILKTKTKLVVTIHDLIHWIFKDQFGFLKNFYAKNVINCAIKNSDHIIAVSNRTKEDLVHYFGANPNKISVIYEGVSSAFRPLQDGDKIEEMKIKYNFPTSYFLYVGMLKPHKNVQWLLRVYKQLRISKKIQSGLVIVGKKDMKDASEYNDLLKLQPEGVHHLENIPFEDLITIYNGAVALVHPSLYEGFGLTLLEAMACGTPVIASQCGSIPEISGDASILVKPNDDNALMTAMEEIESSPKMRSDLSLRGFKNCARFNWMEAANQTLKVYEQVLNGN